MRRMQRLRIASIAIISAALAAPTPSEAAPLAGCEFCSSSCPSQLAVWCAEQGCGAGGGTSCAFTACPGSDNKFWHYKISCGAAW